MHGIAIKLTDSLACGGMSCFYYLFNPIFSLLREYYWVRIIGDNFVFPLDWFDNEDENKDDPRLSWIFSDFVKKIDCKSLSEFEGSSTEFAAILDISYIEKYSQYFSDDWDEIYLFDKNNLSCMNTLLKYLAKYVAIDEIESLIDNEIKAVFHNYDGAFWEFYTSSNEVMNVLISYLITIEGLEYKILDFPGLSKLNDASGDYLTKIGW